MDRLVQQEGKDQPEHLGQPDRRDHKEDRGGRAPPETPDLEDNVVTPDHTDLSVSLGRLDHEATPDPREQLDRGDRRVGKVCPDTPGRLADKESEDTGAVREQQACMVLPEAPVILAETAPRARRAGKATLERRGSKDATEWKV
jgi:hypothetical protein